MPTRTGRPPKITRAEIVAAALRVIETDGVGALTMRRLARELGTTAMAIYHHVRDKDELLLLLLDDYAAATPRPELPDDPRERLVTAATAMRDALARHPWAVDVLRADDLFAVGALWYPEQIIDAAVRGGLTIEDAVDVYRIVWHYTSGEIGGRAAARERREQGGSIYRERVFTEIDAGRFPRLGQVGSRWEELTARDTYAKGVRGLAVGLLP